MNIVLEGSAYKNLTATGTVYEKSAQLVGFYVNSTTGGTMVLRTDGSGGTAISGTMTPAIGFHAYPGAVTNLHATIGGTLDVTFFYLPIGV